MSNPLVAVSGCSTGFPALQHAPSLTPQVILLLGQTRSRRECFALQLRKNNGFAAEGVRFDRRPISEHNCVYVNPVEGWQARLKIPGFTDGAKRYFCNGRRSSF